MAAVAFEEHWERDMLAERSLLAMLYNEFARAAADDRESDRDVAAVEQVGQAARGERDSR